MRENGLTRSALESAIVLRGGANVDLQQKTTRSAGNIRPTERNVSR